MQKQLFNIINSCFRTCFACTAVTTCLTLVSCALLSETKEAEEESKGAMILIPAGEFLMGSDHADADESPRQTAKTDAYYIDQHEVTNAEFKKFDAKHKFHLKHSKFPAEVNWNQATAYANWAGKRLPTEAEWEKAARGTDGRTYPWGETFDWGFVNWDEKVAPGGSEASPVSPYGCLEMAGGVWEWTANDYAPYPGNTIPSIAYGKGYKVIRGGATFNDMALIRTTQRYYLPPDTKGHYRVGFRCVKDAQ